MLNQTLAIDYWRADCKIIHNNTNLCDRDHYNYQNLFLKDRIYIEICMTQISNSINFHLISYLDVAMQNESKLNHIHLNSAKIYMPCAQ